MSDRMLEYTGPFKDVISGFVEFKRALGYDYGYTDLYRLREIDLFFKEQGETEVRITEELFEAWIASRDGESETNRRRRANKLIGFAKYLRSRGYPDVHMGEMPCKAPPRQANPHVFTKEEMTLVFAAAKIRANGDCKNDDNAAFVAMLALYYCCGLRKSEAQNLRMRDVDLDTGCIRIMDSKNHVSRLVVASESLLLLLRDYCRKYCRERSDNDAMFVSGRCKKFSDHCLYRAYRETLEDAGIQPRENGRLPRLHDLRHTFCVHTLEAMAKKGFDLYVSLPLLVKYLGHKCVSESEYYLRLVEENFTAVTDKSKAYAPTLIPKVGSSDGQ
jgi:integrase